MIDQSVEYCLADQGDTAPETGWTNINPGAVKGKWLWVRTKLDYSNSTSSVSEVAMYSGVNGNRANPVKPEQTVRHHISTPFKPTHRYCWLQLIASISAGKTYLGTYTDYTQADSTDPSKYAWSLIKGDKGDTGQKETRVSKDQR